MFFGGKKKGHGPFPGKGERPVSLTARGEPVDIKCAFHTGISFYVPTEGIGARRNINGIFPNHFMGILNARGSVRQ